MNTKRRSLAVVGSIFAVIALASGCSSGASEDAVSSADMTEADARQIVTVQSKDFRADLQEFRQRGYDVAGVNLHASEIDLIVDTATMDALRAEGFSVAGSNAAALAKKHGTNPLASYHQPADIQTLLATYASKYPTLASVQSIGKSGQNRDIWALKITKDVTAAHDPSKPVVLFNGAHHAREVMSVEVPLDTIDTLLTGYGTDTKVTHWVDSNEIWVMPMFNVDGTNQVFTNDNMWRKNTKGCPASGKCASGTGVDVNRNYPYQWASCQGSSTDKSQDDYHGTKAGSEVETQAMMNFVGEIRPVFDISYHSYSELVLYPYGCDGQNVPTSALMGDIANKMAALLPSDDSPGKTYTAGTPWETLYAVDGDDMSWMYHQYGVMAYAIEINGNTQGFQPSYSQWRTKTVNKLRPAWELLLDRLDQSGVRGVVANVPDGAQVSVAPASGTSGPTQTRAVNPDGSFHVVTEAGTYVVTVSAPGHTSFTQTVTVNDARVDLNVTL